MLNATIGSISYNIAPHLVFNSITLDMLRFTLQFNYVQRVSARSAHLSPLGYPYLCLLAQDLSLSLPLSSCYGGFARPGLGRRRDAMQAVRRLRPIHRVLLRLLSSSRPSTRGGLGPEPDDAPMYALRPQAWCMPLLPRTAMVRPSTTPARWRAGIAGAGLRPHAIVSVAVTMEVVCN